MSRENEHGTRIWMQRPDSTTAIFHLESSRIPGGLPTEPQMGFYRKERNLEVLEQSVGPSLGRAVCALLERKDVLKVGVVPVPGEISQVIVTPARRFRDSDQITSFAYALTDSLGIGASVLVHGDPPKDLLEKLKEEKHLKSQRSFVREEEDRVTRVEKALGATQRFAVEEAIVNRKFQHRVIDVLFKFLSEMENGGGRARSSGNDNQRPPFVEGEFRET